jgi:uncharacterized membrane protein YgcG
MQHRFGGHMQWIRVFLLVSLIGLFSSSVHAQSDIPPIPAAPANGNFVLDELDWLTGKQEFDINAIIQQLDQEGIAQIAVVTLNDCGSDKLAFRKQLFDTWGIGHTNDNDGLLILVCWYDGDPSRRSVEQLYGAGLNGILNASKTDQIAQQDFVPAFHQNNAGAGLISMVRDYDGLLRSSSNPLGLAIQSWNSLDGGVKTLLVLLVLGIAFAVKEYFSPRSRKSSRDRDWYSGSSDHDSYGDGGGFDGGSSSGGGGSSTGF